MHCHLGIFKHDAMVLYLMCRNHAHAYSFLDHSIVIFASLRWRLSWLLRRLLCCINTMTHQRWAPSEKEMQIKSNCIIEVLGLVALILNMVQRAIIRENDNRVSLILIVVYLKCTHTDADSFRAYIVVRHLPSKYFHLQLSLSSSYNLNVLTHSINACLLLMFSFVFVSLRLNLPSSQRLVSFFYFQQCHQHHYSLMTNSF